MCFWRKDLIPTMLEKPNLTCSFGGRNCHKYLFPHRSWSNHSFEESITFNVSHRFGNDSPHTCASEEAQVSIYCLSQFSQTLVVNDLYKRYNVTFL